MKLFVACPLRGAHLHAATSMSLLRLIADPEVTYHYDTSLNEDLVRVRSRLAAKFLDTDADHLLFVDSDVSFPIATVHTLIAANQPIVGAPYPKKSHEPVRTSRPYAKRADGKTTLVAAPTWWPLGNTRDDGLMPALVPMGCTLIQREVIEAVAASQSEPHWQSPHRPTLERLLLEVEADSPAHAAIAEAIRQLDEANDLTYADIADKRDVVAIFMLKCGMGPKCANRNLWPEDYSFCMRANALGFESFVHMGTEAFHHEGSIMFPVEIQNDQAPSQFEVMAERTGTIPLGRPK
jgi:hypothetical protein